MQQQNPPDNQAPTPADHISPIPVPGTPPPAPYPYAFLFQQPPSAYTVPGTTNGIFQAGLIGGAIASGIDTLIFCLFCFFPAIWNALTPLYKLGSLLPAGMLNVGALIITLLIALLCSPGFFVAGLQAIHKTGRMNAAMLACTLALIGFAMVDLILTIAPYFTVPFSPHFNVLSELFMIDFWTPIIQIWLIDLLIMGPIGYGAAALGATYGKQPRH